jgi:hypothetical protein
MKHRAQLNVEFLRICKKEAAMYEPVVAWWD